MIYDQWWIIHQRNLTVTKNFIRRSFDAVQPASKMLINRHTPIWYAREIKYHRKVDADDSAA